MIKTLDDVRDVYTACDSTDCKQCPLNVFVDAIPAQYNGGEPFRTSICDLLVYMNNYYSKLISKILG